MHTSEKPRDVVHAQIVVVGIPRLGGYTPSRWSEYILDPEASPAPEPRLIPAYSLLYHTSSRLWRVVLLLWYLGRRKVVRTGRLLLSDSILSRTTPSPPPVCRSCWPSIPKCSWGDMHGIHLSPLQLTQYLYKVLAQKAECSGSNNPPASNPN